MDMWKPMSDPELPLDGHSARRADPRRVVLVHGPVHRAAHAGGAERGSRAPRDDLRRLPQAASAVHLRGAGAGRLRAAKSGRISSSPRPDQALPALVGSLLPAGLRGLVVAGLMAALMSSLSSVFNSRPRSSRSTSTRSCARLRPSGNWSGRTGSDGRSLWGSACSGSR